MTQDEILSAAKEAGFHNIYWTQSYHIEIIEAFTKIIERRTIERCATEVDKGPDDNEWNYDSEYDIGLQHGYVNAAAAIRKLGDRLLNRRDKWLLTTTRAK